MVLPGGHAVSPVMAERTLAWLVEALAPGMRVSLGLPVDRVDTGAELVSGDAIADLAVAYERLGFHAAYVTDHPAPDDRWLAGGGHHAMEPTVALAVAAAATRHLLVHTNVYVLAVPQPVPGRQGPGLTRRRQRRAADRGRGRRLPARRSSRPWA